MTNSGAAAPLASRVAATNTLFPNAFLRVQAQVPSTDVDADFAEAGQWTWSAKGPLVNCHLNNGMAKTMVSEWLWLTLE